MIIYKLREHRKAAGLTQEQLAKAAGVARETIIRLEKGLYNPSLELAYKICSILNCEIIDTFVYKPDKITKEHDSIKEQNNKQEKDNIYNKGYLYFKEKSSKIEWSNFLCFCDELEEKEIDLDIIETNIVKYWRAYINSDQVK